MVYTPEELMDDSTMSVGKVATLKKPSSRKLISKILALLYCPPPPPRFSQNGICKKSARQSGQAMIYGPLFISRGVIQKSITALKIPFIIGFKLYTGC